MTAAPAIDIASHHKHVTNAAQTPTKSPKQDKTPPLYKLAKIPFTYFLPDQRTREDRKAKRKKSRRKDAEQPKVKRKGTGPTLREENEAKLRKLILMTIAGYGNADGTECWASAETIAFDTGCGVRCVSDHKAALISAGYISRDSRRNHTDDCTVHIPEHVWTEVQMKSKAHKEMMAARASRGGWGRPTRTKVDAACAVKVDAACAVKVDAACAVKVDAACAADDLSLTSCITSFLPLPTAATENKQDSLKDDGPKQVHRQEGTAPETLADNLCHIAKREVAFKRHQVLTLSQLLAKGYTIKELETAWREQYEKVCEYDGLARLKKIDFLVYNFLEEVEQRITSIRRDIAQKEREAAAVAAHTAKMQEDTERERRARLEAAEREKEAYEEELPD